MFWPHWVTVAAIFYFGEVFMAYKTILQPAKGELIEQRSRFLSFAYPVITEEDAVRQIAAHRQIYWDARHNVYAYCIAEGNITRYSDDGEPHSTAGKPVLEILSGAQITNCLLLVTRYFGGILLGTGGLVRAYSGAARLAIEHAEIVEMHHCVKYVLETNYAMYDKLSAFLRNKPVKVLKSDFSEKVCIEIVVPLKIQLQFCIDLKEAFFNEIIPRFIEECMFAF